jgi:DNA repair protein SbcC/Rad50
VHIRSVTAEAFGPFTGETLTLSRGLTVISGDNESAKSSWHAAIYAGLCGRRRAKGPPQAKDRDFADRRRPWDGSAWRVRCEVELDDGRIVTLHHDLDGKVDCRAYDNRGLDLSNEIMYEGSPDGSRWLGLNRRAFAATACVNQAELLKVLEAAGELQRDIQRAAATAGKDETAAAALAALKRFSSEHVGKNHANSRRPLRTALTDVDEAEAAHAAAQLAHQDYLRLVSDAEAASEQALAASTIRAEAETAALEAAQRVHALEALEAAQSVAAQAQCLADERQTKAKAGLSLCDRARDLSASLPATAPPSGGHDDAVVQRVSRALGSWQSAPQVPPLAGASEQQLREQIADLPTAPTGDTEVDPSVEVLRDAYLQAAAVVERDERHRVPPPEELDLSVTARDVTPSQLRAIAEQLAAPIGAVEPKLEADLRAAGAARAAAAAALTSAEERESAAVAAASDQADNASDRMSVPAGGPRVEGRFATAAGGSLLALGVVLLVLGQVTAGTALVLVGLTTVFSRVLLRRSPAAHPSPSPSRHGAAFGDRLSAARVDLRDARDCSLRAERAYLAAESRLRAARTAHGGSISLRQRALDEATQRGLPADPGRLRAFADSMERLSAQSEAFQRWRREYDADEEALQSAGDTLATALRERGYLGADVLQTFTDYERDCVRRNGQARRAERRAELQRQLDDRIAADQRAERIRCARREAIEELLRAAQAAGLASDTEIDAAVTSVSEDETRAESAAASIAGSLQTWLHERGATLAETDRQRSDWAELRTLLAGRTLADVEAEVECDLRSAEAARREASEAAAAVLAAECRLAEVTNSVGVETAADPDEARDLLEASQGAASLARAHEQRLHAVASSHRGRVAEREQSMPSVPEAEESMERARRELHRVRSLATVLDLTTDYLQRAQDKTYNDLAPILNKSLDMWLPRVTHDRYLRSRVDPESLEVRVESASGAVFRADLLSVGTAEQIYLLLRVALAEHLADKKTVSPLLLDDVTVQADPTRTEAVLEMCKALADGGRQVVLFAQDPSVAAWAEAHLEGDRHSLIRLGVPAVA